MIIKFIIQFFLVPSSLQPRKQSVTSHSSFPAHDDEKYIISEAAGNKKWRGQLKWSLTLI